MFEMPFYCKNKISSNFCVIRIVSAKGPVIIYGGGGGGGVSLKRNWLGRQNITQDQSWVGKNI